MTREEANAVYDVLVRECGAEEWSRIDFINEFARAGHGPVWRFVNNDRAHVRFRAGNQEEAHIVDVLREDRTPERLAMIERANAAFREMMR